MMLLIINKKIKVELSKDEILAFKHCIEAWIGTLNFMSADLEQKAAAQIAWNLHQKAQQKLVKLTERQHISFDYMQAYVAQTIINDLMLYDILDHYHNNVLTRINYQLHKQS